MKKFEMRSQEITIEYRTIEDAMADKAELLKEGWTCGQIKAIPKGQEEFEGHKFFMKAR